VTTAPFPDARLRVAVLAPIAWRTPPRHYGPWEQFASLLTEGLVAAGHDVTLFATADSVTTATLCSTATAGWSDDASIDPKVAECLHIASVFERADEFDLIHNGFDFLPLTYSGLVATPVITTIHGFSSPAIVPVYERYDATTHYVAISDADRHPSCTTRRPSTTASTRPHVRTPSGHRRAPAVLRSHPSRQGHRPRDRGRTSHRTAVSTSRASCRTSSTSEPRSNRISTARRPLPRPDRAEERVDVLGGARALLHLIDFDEPFGYSVVEAMACGTPVIATARGSMTELIEHGMTGSLVTGLDDAVAAVEQVGRLDREAIRATAAARFDTATMVDEYVRVYRKVLEGRPAA
jgi:hypothetical protein